MYHINCSEIWGGNQEIDTDVCTGSMTASLFSSSADGGKGGDIYYFSVCGQNRLTRIALADVVGHGKDVSNTSQWLYDSLAYRMNRMDGSVILDDLNMLVSAHGHRAITTAEVITFQDGGSSLNFSYAGHPPLLIRRQGENSWNKVMVHKPSQSANIPLGVLETTIYDEKNIALNKGDVLFAYTDGVIEVPGSEGQIFGLERLLNVLEANGNCNPNQLKHTVLKELYKFSQGPFIHDDVTLLAIEIN